MTESLPGPDELIERAARTMRNRFSMQTPPTEEDYANARALARDGLLADPGLQAEVERLRAQVEELTDFAGEQSNARRESDRVRNLAAREVADLRDEVATARQETEDVRESHGLVVSDRDELSIKLEDVTIALQGDGDFKPVLVNPAVDQIQALRVERDQLQADKAVLAEEAARQSANVVRLAARIDAALALVTDHHSMEVQRVGIEAIRAALQGSPPSPPLPVSGEQATEEKHSHGRDCCWNCFHGLDIHPVGANDAACEYENCKPSPVSGAPEEQQ